MSVDLKRRPFIVTDSAKDMRVVYTGILPVAGNETAFLTRGLLGVNRGSEIDPRFLELRWVPEGKPRWEAGVAFLGANSPDYPAAGTRDWRGVIAPIVIYRGPWLRVDDNGVRGRIFDTEHFELDLSGAAGFNARSNAARAGMPDLDYTLEVGPQAVYRIPLSPGQQFSAHLKARAVISTDGRRTNGRGMVVEQELRWTRRGWRSSARASPAR